MEKQISPKIIALTFGILVVIFSATFYIFAWQEMGSTPPEGNVPVPINVGFDDQEKEGSIVSQRIISATQFTDRDNPSYYLNPSGSSNLGGDLTVEGTLNPSRTTFVGEDLKIGGSPSWGGKTFKKWALVYEQDRAITCYNAADWRDKTCAQFCAEKGYDGCDRVACATCDNSIHCACCTPNCAYLHDPACSDRQDVACDGCGDGGSGWAYVCGCWCYKVTSVGSPYFTPVFE